jgi:hypothetical protein
MIFNPKQKNTCLSAGVLFFRCSAAVNTIALHFLRWRVVHSTATKIIPLIVVYFPSI